MGWWFLGFLVFIVDGWRCFPVFPPSTFAAATPFWNDRVKHKISQKEVVELCITWLKLLNILYYKSQNYCISYDYVQKPKQNKKIPSEIPLVFCRPKNLKNITQTKAPPKKTLKPNHPKHLPPNKAAKTRKNPRSLLLLKRLVDACLAAWTCHAAVAGHLRSTGWRYPGGAWPTGGCGTQKPRK